MTRCPEEGCVQWGGVCSCFPFLSCALCFSSFVGVEFSTNPAKYTKYTPAVLEAMLNKFFDEESG